ncbi:MAG: hypothetical protein ABSD82_12160 [Solirubrobacteraceae bacterium]
MSENLRTERGWISVNGIRRDDGTIEFGTADETGFSALQAMSRRRDAQIIGGQILRASAQRLAFRRRQPLSDGRIPERLTRG